MAQPTARDLMTRDVVSVPPETPVAAVARLLAERGISAVPVLDQAGALKGIVTEADLVGVGSGYVQKVVTGRQAAWHGSVS